MGLSPIQLTLLYICFSSETPRLIVFKVDLGYTVYKLQLKILSDNF